jgi:hypothetical protein
MTRPRVVDVEGDGQIWGGGGTQCIEKESQRQSTRCGPSAGDFGVRLMAPLIVNIKACYEMSWGHYDGKGI